MYEKTLHHWIQVCVTARIDVILSLVILKGCSICTEGKSCSDHLRVVHIHCQYSHFMNALREYELLADNLNRVHYL